MQLMFMTNVLEILYHNLKYKLNILIQMLLPLSELRFGWTASVVEVLHSFFGFLEIAQTHRRPVNIEAAPFPNRGWDKKQNRDFFSCILANLTF